MVKCIPGQLFNVYCGWDMETIWKVAKELIAVLISRLDESYLLEVISFVLLDNGK